MIKLQYNTSTDRFSKLCMLAFVLVACLNAKPEIDPTLAELFRAFDERYDALLTLPSVEERRRAAHELMPLLVTTAVSATAQS